MKKGISFLLAIMCILLMAGCGMIASTKDTKTAADKALQSDAEENAISVNFDDMAAQKNPTEQADTEEVSNTVDAEEKVPSWATGMQMEGKLYQNLNLDGVGEADDEAYVSIYQFGDYEDKVTVISIHLGTGETMAQIFPVYGNYSFLTGKVFSEEKDAIILEVDVPASNYGVASIFVLNVSPVGVDPIPMAVTILDTENPITLADGTVIDNSFITGTATRGTKAVDVSGMPRQGILMYFLDKDGRFQGLQRIFYWTDDGWTVISEEVQK